jgi:hypothetical protein
MSTKILLQEANNECNGWWEVGLDGLNIDEIEDERHPLKST